MALIHYLRRRLDRIDRRRMALGQALLAALIALASLAMVFAASDAANISGQELDLSHSGRAWELNDDHNGHLWLSDYQAGEIWHLNPATEVYTVYKGLTGASDGRLDANGDLWWSEYDNYRFGKLDLATDIRTVWPLTGSNPGFVSGLNFDDQGRVWLTASSQPYLYRFDPQSDEFCRFDMPNNGASVYIESHDGDLWLADWKFPNIYRIDPDNGSYKEWAYNRLSDPRGMTFDDNGHLWWGGYFERAALFRLDPNSPFVTLYNLPDDTSEPVMVDAQHGFIWYSDYTGRFGLLNPRSASGTINPVTTDISTLKGELCYQDWQPVGTNNTPNSNSSFSWSTGVYSVTTGPAGWKSYHLPEDSVDWGPWGIRAGDDGVWVVDQERQKLIHLPSLKNFVPLLRK